MEEYIFLFVLAFIWIMFAVVQDLRTREISNWLNFSLIAFVLAYRAFYSLNTGEWKFLLFGVGGILLFVGFGYLFYYSKVFAGGDAKLLFGLGGVLPFESLTDYLYYGGGFIFLLFFVGVFYSLIYSGFLALGKKEEFKKEFKIIMKKSKKFTYIVLIFSILLVLVLYIMDFGFSSLSFLLFALFPFVYAYTKTVEKVCMIKEVRAEKLMEGDWLEKDVRVGKKWIRKSVHGLSMKEINILKKGNRKVWIKDGIPFSPAFLGAFVLGVLWFLRNSAF